MGSAGHADNSIGNFNNNRNLLKSNRNRYSIVKDAYLHHMTGYAAFKQRKLSAEELAEIKRDIRRQIINEQRRRILITISIALPIVLLIAIGFIRVVKA